MFLPGNNFNIMKLDKEKIWAEVLSSARVSVSLATYNTWLANTHLSSLRKVDANRYIAEIGCASSYVKSTVEKRYFGLLQDSLIKALGSPCDLVFEVKGGVRSSTEFSPVVTPLFQREENQETLMRKVADSRLRPGFKFENFAVSATNHMAQAAAEAVAREPGTSYNPLFIWGGVGVGKTHLMHAVGHKLISTSEKRVLAVTGEDFTNDIVEGIRNKTTQAFREKYRKLHALLIDDIQFIAGKDAVQDEFFHTFNAVLSAGGQIIMTADKPPQEITRLEERLLSRFQAGLIVDISPPDFELRCAIVQIKSEEKGLGLTDELVQVVAGSVDSARALEGFLIRLQSESKIKNRPIDVELITSILGKGVEDKRIAQSNPDRVIDAVCSHYSIGKRALLGKGRARLSAHPRQVLMYILRTELNLPLEEVGRLVGGRDHSTVIHGVDKITKMAATNVGIRDDILRIKGFIGG